MGIKTLEAYGQKVKARSIALTLTVLLFLPATVSAQDQQVILPAREVTVKTAFGEIEKQTSYKVAVNWELFDADKKVLLSANRLSVRDIMNEALSGTNCRWEMSGSQLFVMNRQKEEGAVYSAMQRNNLPTQMKVVKDPWSKKELSAEQISRIRNGYWRNEGGKGNDSIGLAILNFRVNSSMLERDYMDNARVLKMIHETISDKDRLAAMEFITVTSGASPEGRPDANDKLAADRAMAVKSYLMWRYPFLNRENIFTFSIGEDWSGLRKMVENDLRMPNRGQVLEILNLDIDSSDKELRLRQLDGGSAYRYMAANMLPKLRGAAACMIYYREVPEPTFVYETKTDTIYVDRVVEKTVEVSAETKTPVQETPYYMAIKTNLLNNIALLPNVAMEFSLGRRWSMEIEGQWSWWNTKTTHNNCWRIQTAGLEVRKWLGDKSITPLSGHYLGVYGAAGTYDIKFRDKDGYLSDMSYSVGVSYGYSKPIARRLNLEFGIALGYVGGKYKVYDQYSEEYDIFPLKEERNLSYFGPTKAKISLVWLIGSGVNDTKKR